MVASAHRETAHPATGRSRRSCMGWRTRIDRQDDPELDAAAEELVAETTRLQALCSRSCPEPQSRCARPRGAASSSTRARSPGQYMRDAWQREPSRARPRHERRRWPRLLQDRAVRETLPRRGRRGPRMVEVLAIDQRPLRLPRAAQTRHRVTLTVFLQAYSASTISRCDAGSS
jgi:hypothetical protein